LGKTGDWDVVLDKMWISEMTAVLASLRDAENLMLGSGGIGRFAPSTTG
jgi:hypothetical protein